MESTFQLNVVKAERFIKNILYSVESTTKVQSTVYLKYSFDALIQSWIGLTFKAIAWRLMKSYFAILYQLLVSMVH